MIRMIFAIDFDGTCVTHSYPDLGLDIGAAPVLRELVENDHQLILWTMRSNVAKEVLMNDHKIYSGNFLDIAVKWFEDRDIPLYGIQSNPTQHTWTTSPKAYAHIYIDDAALGCPVIYHPKYGKYVDWDEVRRQLVALGLIVDNG